MTEAGERSAVRSAEGTAVDGTDGSGPVGAADGSQPPVPDAAPPDGLGWRLRHLPFLLGVSAVAVVLAAIVGAIAAGGTGAAGAAIGVGVVTLSYAASTVVLAWVDWVNPRLVLVFGLSLYGAKVAVLGAAVGAVAAADWAGLEPLCLGIAAGVVGWTGAHVWWISRVHARRVHVSGVSR